MKLLTQGIALAVVGAGLFAVPSQLAQAAPSAPNVDPGIQAIKNEADGGVVLRTNPATGKIGFAAAQGADADLMPGRAAATGREAAAKAGAYLDKFSAVFGAARGQLVETDVQKSDLGWTVSYDQSYKNVDVFGARIKVNVDSDGDLTAVNGYAAPGLSLSTTPRLTPAQAGSKALAAVRFSPALDSEGKDADLSGIAPKNATLVVYRKGALKGETGDTVLAYQVEVTNKANIRDMVFVDADTGKAINRYSMANDALDRELYEATGTPQAPVLTKVWQEGDAFPAALNQDQQNLVNSSGESYWLFENTFGRDSYDGLGAKRITVNNDPRIACPNANWNGITTNYCNGVTSDDVVSHEWGHAYTEYTSGLIYQYQPGALNESYSDVWGETLDLINGREDEGEGDLTLKRADGTCDPTAPPALIMTINSPAGIAGPCRAVSAPAAAGGGFSTTPISADVVEALDAANPTGPTTQDGCTAFTNAAAVNGKWAYVDRGTCAFQTKYDNAVAAGATGLVIGNNQPNAVPNSPAVTGSIKAVHVSKEDGTRFKAANVPVNVTIKAEDISTRTATSRWLVGEKATAFGGAIRDMWTPTCYGNPGKVSDAEYNCDPLLTDAGGVHGNSGVPNHAYALVTDGGTFNGQTVAGLGLDKAAHIWWRAQTAYLTPSSGFPEAADALQQSCVDLVGQPINKLSTEPNATPLAATPVAAADCASITAAVAATEMRTPPVKCDFQPAFDANTPATCGEGFETTALYSEDFEDGLAGWTASFETVYDGGIHDPWAASTTAPTGNGDAHPGGVAYGPTPAKGQCTEGVGDFSSRDSIASPIIELPTTLRSPKMTFDHYLATESTYDGGNVKVSINGGDYAVIPEGAFIFNANNSELQPTNPLEGEEGFSGTDGGKVDGSWVQSQVDLQSLDVQPGDTVQFRFDIGRDGCGGVDGWYIDNVQVIQCQLKTKVSGVHLPEPSTFGTASSVKVTVERDGNKGSAPTGDVTLTKADGAAVASGTLVDGTATIALPADLAVGAYTMKANYAGDATLAPSTSDVTVTVTAATATPTPTPTPTTTPTPTPTPVPGKADTTTRVKVKPGKVKRGRTYKIIVKVKSSEDVTGKVKVKIDGRKVGRALLKNGRVVLKFKAYGLRLGKHKIKAKYVGTPDLKRSADKVKFRVVR